MITYKNLINMINKTDDWYAEYDEDYLNIQCQGVEEDFCIEVCPKEWKQKIYEVIEYIQSYCLDFDVYSHVEEWIKYKNEGVQGVPCLQDLIEDSKKIDMKLNTLYRVLREVA